MFQEGDVPFRIATEAVGKDHQRIGPAGIVHRRIQQGVPICDRHVIRLPVRRIEREHVLNCLLRSIRVQRRIPEVGLHFVVRAFADDKGLVSHPLRASHAVLWRIGSQAAALHLILGQNGLCNAQQQRTYQQER